MFVLQAAQETYRDLDRKLFEAYIEQKSDPIVGAMEPNMYRGGFEWKHWKKPTGLSSSIEDILYTCGGTWESCAQSHCNCVHITD